MTPIVGRTPAAATKLTVDLGPRSYDIHVGEGLLAVAGRYLAPVLAQPRVVVVTDDAVAPSYLLTLEAASADEAIEATSVVLAAGESTKDFGHLQELTEKLLATRIERGTTIVALGGGVVGDIAGFAAAITLRGLPFVQIPTTLLAQVDSSIGGKTGINTGVGKNLIGAFHQPRRVLTDIATLETLPRRQLLAGYAEVVKYGLIGDAEFFAWLEDNAARLLNGDAAARRHAVLTCCAAKAAIVAADEREAGQRSLLNLGHTLAHALEARTGYGEALLHGEAVAVGLVLAFHLSVRLGLCSSADAERVRRHLAAAGLPVDVRKLADMSWSADDLIAHMERDKKVKDGKLAFVLAHGIGRSFISREVNRDEVGAFLKDVLGA